MGGMTLKGRRDGGNELEAIRLIRDGRNDIERKKG
jgi:hypothetical protein